MQNTFGSDFVSAAALLFAAALSAACGRSNLLVPGKRSGEGGAGGAATTQSSAASPTTASGPNTSTTSSTPSPTTTASTSSGVATCPSTSAKLAAAQDSPYGLALHGEYVWFGTSSGLRRVPRCGGEVEAISADAVDEVTSSALGVAYLSYGAPNGRIDFVPAGSASPVTLVPPKKEPSEFLFAPLLDDQGLTYAVWTSVGAARLERVGLTPNAPTVVLANWTTPQNNVSRLAQNSTTVFVCHIDAAAGGLVEAVRKDGSGSTTLANVQFVDAMVADDDQLFLASAYSGWLLDRIDLATGQVSASAAMPVDVFDLALDEGHLYWSDWSLEGGAGRMGRDLGGFTQFAFGASTPAIAVDAEAAYFTDLTNGQVVRVAKGSLL